MRVPPSPEEFAHEASVRLFLAVCSALLALLPQRRRHATTAAQAARRRMWRTGQTKIDVMGEWAHPDDDTSIIGPCGVWHQRYGVKCGVIQVTRGEGGGNAVGNELGPGPRAAPGERGPRRALPLRHGRHLQPGPDRLLLQPECAADAVLLGRAGDAAPGDPGDPETQPEIYIGFTPTLAPGHGNHQQAGRLIWEGVLAAADPTRFPEQLRGRTRLSTWQVKKVFSGGSTAGTGGTTTAANCTTGFTPTGLDTVAGVWTGYDSPYKWPAGNLQGQPAGTPKIWQQVADEGRAAYPTQSRVMFKGTSAPACPRFGMTESFVPFQPNTQCRTQGRAGRRDPVRRHQTRSRRAAAGNPGVPDLLPLPATSPGAVPGDCAPHARKACQRQRRAHRPARLDRPTDRSTVPSATAATSPSPSPRPPTRRSTRTPRSPPSTPRHKTGYTDNVVRIVSPAEGRFQRWGNWQEYDEWLATPPRRRTGSAGRAAIQSMAVGSTLDVPVVVHNWSRSRRAVTCHSTLPAELHRRRHIQALREPRRRRRDHSHLPTHQHRHHAPRDAERPIPITTTYAGGSGNETLTLTLVPKTAIAAGANHADSRRHGRTGRVPTVRRSTSAASGRARPPAPAWTTAAFRRPGGSTAKVSWSDDALYFFIHVRDDYQSYAVTPAECVGHWQADSVEILLDPRGTASQALKDTANTFKLGIFPFTNDPTK